MKRFSWILLLTLISTTLTLAQNLCPLLEVALEEALVSCYSVESDSLCYGAGTLSLETSAETSPFATVGYRVSLAEVMTLESTNADDNLAIAIMRLNYDDVDMRFIAYGTFEIENTVQSNMVSVSALRSVNLRQAPSVEATVIGSLVARQEYTAIGRLADNTWLQIRLEDGRIGWASAQYLSSVNGFTELNAATPSSPVYLPMQSLTLSTGDCSGVLMIMPEMEDEAIIVAVNGAQIQSSGLIHLYTEDDMLFIHAIDAEALVNTFGFEISLSTGELTSVQLGATNTIINIATEAEAHEIELFSEDIIEMLQADN